MLQLILRNCSIKLPSQIFRRDKYKIGLAFSIIIVFYQLWNSPYTNFNISYLSESLPTLSKSVPDNISTNYQKIFEKYSVNEYYHKTDFQTRCDIYFSSLSENDMNWFLNPNEELSYDSSIYDKRTWINYKIDSIRQDIANTLSVKKDNITITDKIRSQATALFEEGYAKALKGEQIYIDIVSTLRIFNRCYLGSEYVETENTPTTQMKILKNLEALEPSQSTPKKKTTLIERSDPPNCVELEKRMFPWLTGNFPKFTRWDGQTWENFPDLKESLISVNDFFAERHYNSTDGDNSCFLTKMKNSANGRGIIMTIHNGLADDAISLIRLLRGLNNKLPIQIIYYDFLDNISLNKIIHAARENLEAIPKSIEQVEEVVSHEFPKQDVWFVDVSTAINSKFRNKFSSFGNKFLACIFSSFAEYILVDADTVMFEKPDYFFNLDNYKKTGAFFFKDRSINHRRAAYDLTFFRKILPNSLDSLFFGVPMSTYHTLQNNVFRGQLVHLMESGLVVIDRKRHFGSILMIIQSYFHPPTRDRIYGDKDLFWLGFSMNGDENYHLNKYNAAAVGELTPKTERKKSTTRELCSNHPSHVSEDDTSRLLWMNTGFKFCSHTVNLNWETELAKGMRLTNLNSTEEMQDYYSRKLVIKHAIIPPIDVTHMSISPKKDEPSTSWANFPYCSGYMWCAYESFGSKMLGNFQQGTFVEFNQTSQDLYSYYGDLWMGSN